MVWSFRMHVAVISLVHCIFLVQSDKYKTKAVELKLPSDKTLSPTNLKVVTSTTYAACPTAKGWERHGKDCFWFSKDTDTWEDAKKKCKSMGAFLAEPRNSEIDAYITGKGTTFWVGLSDLKEEGKFVWESSGEQAGYVNWQPNDPNNANKGEDCVLINWNQKHKKWVDAPCKWKKNYVCQAKLTCSKGWCQKGESCFWFSKILKTWQGAKETCEKMGAILAEPRDSITDDYITYESISKGIKPWIGLRDKKQEIQFLWESSTELVSYTNWKPGNPNEASCKDHCIVANWQKKWADMPCNSKNHFICQGRLW